MVTSGNVRKHVYYTNMTNIYVVCWHIMVVLGKLSYINSETSVELTANKMQNLLTRQEPESAYNTDVHELQNNCHLTTIWLG